MEEARKQLREEKAKCASLEEALACRESTKAEEDDEQQKQDNKKAAKAAKRKKAAQAAAEKRKVSQRPYRHER